MNSDGFHHTTPALIIFLYQHVRKCFIPYFSQCHSNCIVLYWAHFISDIILVLNNQGFCISMLQNVIFVDTLMKREKKTVESYPYHYCHSFCELISDSHLNLYKKQHCSGKFWTDLLSHDAFVIRKWPPDLAGNLNSIFPCWWGGTFRGTPFVPVDFTWKHGYSVPLKKI